MKPNYSAWSVSVSDFYNATTDRARLEYLVKFGVLAPSSHNSQPWEFQIGDGRITIHPAEARALPSSDENNRQLYISLGCALQNILVAADYYGFSLEVPFRIDGDSVVVSLPTLPAASKKMDANHLINYIARRHTNRSSFASRVPEDDFIKFCMSCATPEIRIDLVSDAALKNKIADIVIDALIDAMDRPDFRGELSQYLKSDMTSSPTGMLAGGFGVPGPASVFASALIRRVNMNKLSRKKDERLLKEQTPMMGVISSLGDTKEDWVRCGMIFEKISLEATKRGLAVSPMAAAIQIGDHYRNLQKVMEISSRPQVFFRLGYPEGKPSITPRLRSEETIVSKTHD